MQAENNSLRKCYFKKVAFLVWFGFLFSGCGPKSNNQLEEQISIKINADSTAIQLDGIDPFILSELKSDSLKTEDWVNYFSIYPRVEEDIQDLQKPISGQYQVKNNTILFKPDTAFIKGKIYLVHLNFQNPNSSVINQMQTKVSPNRPKIIRKELTF